MNRTQIAQLYDSFPESQRDMPREQFIKKAMDAYNPVKNRKILSAMIDRKCQIKAGQIEQARIDAALKRK
jgi:hypothetical protein